MGADWTARLSAGRGYFIPTPFTEETEAIGLSDLAPWATFVPSPRIGSPRISHGRVHRSR